ncbi:hypothetical protein HAX54_042187 [Datura stramonium]|uniref:Uncharacterized protein n=1 Tax=Datura stramonium TaxID=4076 RepID=A0ABS8SN44_DATST|nr:hypothetical protein [Datura stramonium]
MLPEFCSANAHSHALVSAYETQVMTSSRKNTNKHAPMPPSFKKGKNKSTNKGKDTLIPSNVEEGLRFCVEGMNPYFIKYWDDWSFNQEKSFNLSGLGTNSQYQQAIATRD